MRNRKVRTGQPLVKALVCGLLEDDNRILFLRYIDNHGIERVEMPCVLVYSGKSSVAQIKTEFQRQTGLDAEIHEVIIETKYNAGSRRKKNWVPCLVFKVTAKNKRARPSGEFSGFKWLSLEDVKKQKLGRKLEWLRKFKGKFIQQS